MMPDSREAPPDAQASKRCRTTGPQRADGLEPLAVALAPTGPPVRGLPHQGSANTYGRQGSANSYGGPRLSKHLWGQKLGHTPGVYL